MNRNRKFAVGVVILLGAIGYLIYAGVEQGSVYYFTIDEFLGQKEALADQGVRVSGRVAAGSVQKQMTTGGTELRFTMAEPPGVDLPDGLAGLPVHFIGIVPDMFAEGRDVIAEGRYSNGSFEAHTIMTSCPSKYEAGATKPEAG